MNTALAPIETDPRGPVRPGSEPRFAYRVWADAIGVNVDPVEVLSLDSLARTAEVRVAAPGWLLPRTVDFSELASTLAGAMDKARTLLTAAAPARTANSLAGAGVAAQP